LLSAMFPASSLSDLTGSAARDALESPNDSPRDEAAL